MASTAPPSGYTREPRPREEGLWQKISGGSEIDELWSQFSADAQASYGFYGKDLDWEQLKTIPAWRRPLRVAKHYFWALVMKMTPARRVILFIALVLLIISGPKFSIGRSFSFDMDFNAVAALLFLLLLSLELADKVTMKRDLEIAREIQSWLTPSLPPKVAGASIAFHTRPQNSVAGDYYDAFYPMDDGESGGKLFLVMATFQASVHTVAREGTTLEELVARLNRYACAHSLDGRRFTTALLGEYDPATRQLTYVNAGHNAPLLRRNNPRGQAMIERLPAGGVPFGISPDAAYEMATVQLAPGDALVLFTDGVVEAFNAKGEEFTDARWVECVRHLPDWEAQRSLQFLMQRVDDDAGTTKQFDDITCLVLRCD